MPSPILHTAVGSLVYLMTGNLSIDRLYIVAGVTALSILPDFDFLTPFGHRSLTHSLIFCIGTGLLIGRFTPFTYLTSISILLSHLVLDSLADSFASVSWLYPFHIHHSSYNPDLITLIKRFFSVF
jgi:membrane-bound metal-dependent hydrolase YbcI (DUF457 family)